MKASSARTVDDEEVRRFNALARRWWDPAGPMRPLHEMNPVRIAFIKAALCERFGRDPADRQALRGLELLDLGCGAGLASEPLARLGASVSGMDAAPDAIAAARAHASLAGLQIDYKVGGPEALEADRARFDAIVALEVLEHVSDVPQFLSLCRQRLKPGGLLLFSTLNRTLASLATAIVGAEYILRLLPRGTHDWRRFIRPDDLTRLLSNAGFEVGAIQGMVPDVARGGWRLSLRTPVNYIGWARITAPGST